MTIKHHEVVSEAALGFGAEVRAARQRLGITQAEACDMMRGAPHWINSSKLGRIEMGVVLATKPEAELLMHWLDIDSAYFTQLYRGPDTGPSLWVVELADEEIVGFSSKAAAYEYAWNNKAKLVAQVKMLG
jgi:transcriptional regulator with XRE-family HTH domain